MNMRQHFATRAPQSQLGHTQTVQTHQGLPLPGRGQVPNSAGGFAWAVDDWTRLNRFLVLGTEGGTYYIGQPKLTIDSAEAVWRCIEADGERVVRRIVAISEAGRAPKNDPALFALAMCAGLGDEATRRAALEALPRVARIGTHLFHFLEYVEGFRGWGRGLRRAVGKWYSGMDSGRLAYQVVKYGQRNGWSHRDALRLAHPQAPTAAHDAIFHWVTQGWPSVGESPHPDEALRLIWAAERAKLATTEAEIVALIETHRLPWEAVPSQWLGAANVWRALLPSLPLTATLRNLARLTANGVLRPRNAAVAMVTERLADPVALRRARIHPVAVLAALATYQQGRGARGKLEWWAVPQVVDALDAAFYATFQNVEPSGARTLLALDVSGSMATGSVAGVPGLTPRVASAAMALVTAATEPQHTVLGFADELVPLAISPRQRLDDVVKSVSGLPFGRTDCALPMIWATENEAEIDTFVVYTDSETWYGKIHPAQALQHYRGQSGIAAKLVVVGMVANRFTLADPKDAGMLDVVGFDTATPRLIADFAAGRL